MRTILMQVSNMTIGHGQRVLFSGLDLEVCKGDCIMLCGANGSGKTSLLKALARITPTEGEIVMVPTRIPKIKGFTLKEFIRLTEKDREKVEYAMKALGISGLSDRDISTLSDGEFQKGIIATALARRASIILLDEPTAFLDPDNRISVLRSLQNLCTSTGCGVIFSTHDLHDAARFCNKAITIGDDGKARCTAGSIESAISSIFPEAGLLQ